MYFLKIKQRTYHISRHTVCEHLKHEKLESNIINGLIY